MVGQVTSFSSSLRPVMYPVVAIDEEWGSRHPMQIPETAEDVLNNYTTVQYKPLWYYNVCWVSHRSLICDLYFVIGNIISISLLVRVIIIYYRFVAFICWVRFGCSISINLSINLYNIFITTHLSYFHFTATTFTIQCHLV